ncbi:hypothetical protein AB6B38_05620 [Glycocaulis abyssi]|uniref:Uncharacterized protein n=1 Tax=Glycocaulis abyssi TaxID=1433403 RepID=A0ABV9N8D0_9PROT
MPVPFERSVFLNFPFDGDYAPILQSIAFCVIDLGFHVRIAPENADGAAARLDRILELIRSSKFGIHDLSRCKSSEADEYYRMNMPFELGIDHGCRKFGGQALAEKSILILESNKFDYQKGLSDIAGWDIHSHGMDYVEAVRHVRDWLVHHAGADSIGTERVLGDYATFRGWHFEREITNGASERDIELYAPINVIRAMQDWYAAGKPDEFSA